MEEAPEFVIVSDSESDGEEVPTKRVRIDDDSEHTLLKLVRSGANDQQLREALDDTDFTEMLRLATIPEIGKLLWKFYKLRGIHINKEFTLFPHQITALRWMGMRESTKIHGIEGGVLSLQMGMGKTLTSLTHILSTKKGEFPSLVIASKTVLCEWFQNGCQKFFKEGSVKTLFLHKDYLGKELDKITRADIVTYDIVLTTYDTLLSVNRKTNFYESCLEYGDAHSLMNGKIRSVSCKKYLDADKPHFTGAAVIYGTPWHRVICDESQRFANPQTVLYKCVLGVYGKYKWCLSGTPIRNYSTDIWAQFRFCGYNGVDRTVDWVRNGKQRFDSGDLKRAIYYMTYEDAHIELPEIHEHVIEMELDGTQKTMYDCIVKRTMEVYKKMMRGTADFACVLAMFMRMRQCAIAPFLLTQLSKRVKGREDDHVVRKIDSEMSLFCDEKKGEAGFQAVKIRKIIELLNTIPAGEKVVFFTMFTSYLDLVKEAVNEAIPGKKVLKIDGDTKGPDRSAILAEFKADPESTLLLLTYKVGGEGLNITEANHCIYGEPWWTHAVHNQAKARLWRTGQVNDVHVYSLIVKNSIEDRILAICEEKTKMVGEFLGGGCAQENFPKNGGLDKYTLGRMLGFYF